MAILNLRDVPDELAKTLRVEAAQVEMGIKEYCVAILEQRGHYSQTAARAKEQAEDTYAREVEGEGT
jgi:chorismate mutase